MGNEVPDFETRDLQGTTDHFNGTVNTSPIDVPSVAGGVISEFMLHTPKQPGAAVIRVSFDGGTNYIDVAERATLSLPLKGGVTQVKVKSASGNRDYQIIMNRELP